MTDAKRRILLKGSLAAATVGLAAGAGLLSPKAALAAWNEAAFRAEDLDSALQNGFGSTALEDSAEIAIDAPDLAENGATVPITVSTTLAGAETISIVSAKNPTPLAAKFYVSAGGINQIQVRIKMGETGDVIGIVQAGGKLYAARRNVKVTAGGCA